MRVRAYVFIGRARATEQRCRDLGIQPHGQGVYRIHHHTQLLGLVIHDDDHVEWVTPHELPTGERIRLEENLKICRAAGAHR